MTALQKTAVEVLILEGNRLEDDGQVVLALGKYLDAAALEPGYARARLNVGNALERLGRTAEASIAYSEAIRLNPDDARYRYNLARLLAIQGDRINAEIVLRKALELDPSLVQATVALATILAETDRQLEAEALLRSALSTHPDDPGAAFNLGSLLLGQDRFDEAIACWELARALVPNAIGTTLFALNDRPDLDATEIFRRHVVVGRAIERAAGEPDRKWRGTRDPNRKLRIGYVSGDFKLHPVGMFIKPVLEHHDREQFDVVCFETSLGDHWVRDYLKSLATSWHEAHEQGSDKLVEQVRNERIDILVDLSGHTNHNRLEAFARHPAPLQVTWMGYLNTTGLSTIEYRIVDRYTDPPGIADQLSTEMLLRLPNSQWCFDPWWAPSDFVRDSTQRDVVRFGSPHRLSKISEKCVDLWASILRRVPGAELHLLDVPVDRRVKTLERFRERGISRDRIATYPRFSIDSYYAALGNFDITLDTVPYSGGTTTFDSLWMRTPLVAFPGDRPAGRNSFSVLSNLGLSELIAQDEGEYVDINVRLASDPSWRAELRSALRERMLESPLMDAPRFVKDLENCYRAIWNRWCLR